MCVFFFLLDSLTHIQSHLHTVPGVVRQGLRQTGHAVVAISEDLDAHALVFLNEQVKKKKKKKGKRKRDERTFVPKRQHVLVRDLTSLSRIHETQNHTPTQLTHSFFPLMWDAHRLSAGSVYVTPAPSGGRAELPGEKAERG